jgi:predicted metalloprotease with PDZ domain
VFEQYIYGMEPMPYEELLSHAGMVVRKSAAGKSWIGAASFAYSDKGVTLSAGTLRDTPLYIAGLDKGDVISAFGGKPVKTQAEFDGWLNALKPGEAVKLRVESRGGQKDVDLTVGESPAVEVVTFEEAQKSVTPEIAAFREAWLSSKAVHPLPKLEKHCWVCQRKYAFELEHCPYDGQDLHVLPGIEKAAPQQGRSRMR